jgi:membrane-associated phospholipid phosphatase
MDGPSELGVPAPVQPDASCIAPLERVTAWIRRSPFAVPVPVRAQLERVAWIGCALCTFLAYLAVAMVVPEQRAATLSSFADRYIPLVPEWSYAYAAIYPVAIVPLFIIADLRLLRRVVLGFVMMNLLADLVFAIFPTRVERPLPPGMQPASFARWCVAVIYTADLPLNCFPSLHVANAFYVRTIVKSLDRQAGRWMLVIALLIAASTVLVKQHYLPDTVAGALFGCVSGMFTVPRAGWPRDFGLPARRQWFWIPTFYVLLMAFALATYSVA